MLMAREEPETVSKGWCFKERHHGPTDGTRSGRNREQGVVVQRKTPARHTSLMAREEARNREQGVVLQRMTPRTPDGTRIGRNSGARGWKLQRTTPRTY